MMKQSFSAKKFLRHRVPDPSPTIHQTCTPIFFAYGQEKRKKQVYCNPGFAK